MTKVLIGMPTRQDPRACASDRAFMLMTRHNTTFERCARSPVSISRNWLVRLFIDKYGDYTHMLMFDDDVVPPLDCIERLLALDSDVALGLVPFWLEGRARFNAVPKGCTSFPLVPPDGPFEAITAGGACMWLGVTIETASSTERCTASLIQRPAPATRRR